MLSSFFGSPCNLEINLESEPNRRSAPLTRDRRGPKALIYTDGEDVSGTAAVQLKSKNKLEHNGIKVELVGRMEFVYDPASSYDFFVISKDLEPPGVLLDNQQYRWKFNSVDKPHDSYWGVNVRVRYFVRLSVVRGGYAGSACKELDFIVQNLFPEPESGRSIKMEVGIEDNLHIEFEYEKQKYHMKDCVIGKVYFLLVRLKIKHMEIDIIRKETIGQVYQKEEEGRKELIDYSGSTQQTESETLTKFEIMDGCPVKDECVPVRLYLSAIDLTPTYKNIQNKVSVRYFLNLVLVDEEDRRYFKQQEILLWRKKIM